MTLVRPELIELLGAVQLQARRVVAEWAKDPQKRIPPVMFRSFEDSLQKRYESTEPAEKKQVPGDDEKDDQFWVEAFREWASDRSIILTKRTTDELIARVKNLVFENFRPMPEKGVKEFSLNTYGAIVLELLLMNEKLGTDFMMEHLQYQIDYYRENGLRPEYVQGLPVPASWNEPPQSG